MNPASLLRVGLAAMAITAAAATHAGENDAGDGTSGPAAEAGWEWALSIYPTFVRGGEDYTSAIAIADRGALHLEARANYESVGARSAFVGWTFAGGDTVTWKLTPLLGGAWGALAAFIPGLEASVAWGPVDLYVEAEYVRSNDPGVASYAYAWSELGYRPAEWLRVGLAGQRTRIYRNDRELQRGPFAQVTAGHLTLGSYWFNPGSSEQVFVGSIGLAF